MCRSIISLSNITANVARSLNQSKKQGNKKRRGRVGIGRVGRGWGKVRNSVPTMIILELSLHACMHMYVLLF